MHECGANNNIRKPQCFALYVSLFPSEKWSRSVLIVRRRESPEKCCQRKVLVSLTHVWLTVSRSCWLASGSSLAKGVNTACSARPVIRQGAIAPLQCLPNLKRAVPASSWARSLRFDLSRFLYLLISQTYAGGDKLVSQAAISNEDAS